MDSQLAGILQSYVLSIFEMSVIYSPGEDGGHRSTDRSYRGVSSVIGLLYLAYQVLLTIISETGVRQVLGFTFITPATSFLTEAATQSLEPRLPRRSSGLTRR